jgi:hypothetical protein
MGEVRRALSPSRSMNAGGSSGRNAQRLAAHMKLRFQGALYTDPGAGAQLHALPGISSE